MHASRMPHTCMQYTCHTHVTHAYTAHLHLHDHGALLQLAAVLLEQARLVLQPGQLLRDVAAPLSAQQDMAGGT